MGPRLTSITLNTPHLEDMLEFYRIIGIDFKAAKVDKGSQVCRAIIEGCEFSLYSARNLERKNIPSLQISFIVDELDLKVAEISRIPGVTCIMDPTQMPDGKKAIVLDPDGHSVELKQTPA